MDGGKKNRNETIIHYAPKSSYGILLVGMIIFRKQLKEKAFESTSTTFFKVEQK